MTHKQRKYNIYNYINRAIKNQWTIVSSSDGYANYGIGNVLTSDNSGPHGFANHNAWCVLNKNINNQQYQFCLQTDGYMGLRLKYSKLSFTNGMNNLGETPAASDEEVLLGGGTDLAPIYQQIIGGYINFNHNSVMISFTSQDNILNFTLRPTIIVNPVNIVRKLVVNKVLK